MNPILLLIQFDNVPVDATHLRSPLGNALEKQFRRSRTCKEGNGSREGIAR